MFPEKNAQLSEEDIADLHALIREFRQRVACWKPQEGQKDPHDSIPLMNQLARMANIPFGRIRKMVLVLSVDDAPRLFTEEFLAFQEPLKEVPLQAIEEPLVVDITTMQNEQFRTKHEVKREQR